MVALLSLRLRYSSKHLYLVSEVGVESKIVLKFFILIVVASVLLNKGPVDPWSGEKDQSIAPKFTPVIWTSSPVFVFVIETPDPMLPNIGIFPTLLPVGTFVHVTVAPFAVQA